MFGTIIRTDKIVEVGLKDKNGRLCTQQIQQVLMDAKFSVCYRNNIAYSSWADYLKWVKGILMARRPQKKYLPAITRAVRQLNLLIAKLEEQGI